MSDSSECGVHSPGPSVDLPGTPPDGRRPLDAHRPGPISHADQASPQGSPQGSPNLTRMAGGRHRAPVVQVGDPAPSIEAQDIHGRIFRTSDHPDALLVYAAASRDNFEILEKFLKPSMDAVMKKHPTLRCVICSVADLRSVPSAMRGMVSPILGKVDDKNATMTNKGFTDGGSGMFNGYESYFVPDYSEEGSILGAIGCSDADQTFRVFTVSAGRVHGVIHKDTKEVGKVATSAFEDAIKFQPQVAAEWPAPGAPTHTLLEGVVKIGPKKTVSLPGKLLTEGKGPLFADSGPGPVGIGVTFNVDGKHSNITFGLLGAEGVLVIPKRKCECKDGLPCKVRATLPQGSPFEILFKNKGELRSKTVNYTVIASPLPAS